MALPRATDTYEDYTEQLVYFSARLAANPKTAHLAQDVELLVTDIDNSQLALRDARREEVRKRALRDYQDALGDGQVFKYRRRIGGIVGKDHFAPRQIFPKGVEHATAPRTWPQVERLRKVIQATDDVLASPQLAADPEATDLTAVLQAGKATMQQVMTDLEARLEAWEAQKSAVTKAQNAFNFQRTNGVTRLGEVMGELRALEGGDARAAYAYTQSRGGGGGAGDEEAAGDDAPGDDAPAGETPPVDA